MKKSTLIKLALSSGWVGLLALTGVVYMMPLPFRPTLLLVLGIANGRYLARWI